MIEKELSTAKPCEHKSVAVGGYCIALSLKSGFSASKCDF